VRLHKRTARKFSKFLRRSISALPGEWLKEFFSFQMSPLATWHCVAGSMLPADYGLICPVIGEAGTEALCTTQAWLFTIKASD
jgi:hypothetical protein